MLRALHGAPLPLEEIYKVHANLYKLNYELGLPFNVVRPLDLTSFGYMFPELQSQQGALLPESSATVGFLTQLAETMHDNGLSPALNSTIPAAYTYLGQFLDHDITLELRASRIDLTDPKLAPLQLADVYDCLRNSRSATLDLDSVYGDGYSLRQGDEMRLGTVSAAPVGEGVRPVGKDTLNDLPRLGPSLNYQEDRAAEIGDARNDENLIISQLHVAFLRAHNALIKKGYGFDEARKIMRQHYQHLVIHDFLKRIVDPKIVEGIISTGSRFYNPPEADFFLPLEFTVAAYRFGHSMVRSSYDYNLNFPQATLVQLFTFTALSGDFVPKIGVGFLTLPEHWIIEWERFVAGGSNLARSIDTQLVEPLFMLRNEVGGPLSGPSSLALRNLLRGYLLRMPTGQAVARALGLAPLSKQQILDTAHSVEQVRMLLDTGFSDATPLWFYVLAEAKHGGGSQLGPVGGTIVAEVLIGLARRSADSILLDPTWAPKLGSVPGEFKLQDLLRLADVVS
jgi:hypothetical protein